MNDVRDVLPIDRLVGRAVLSLASGNKLGAVRDVFVDAINGVITGLSVETADGEAALSYQDVHSFGHDAIMARGDRLQSTDDLNFIDHPNARELIGTSIITAGGSLLGSIANVFVTLDPPPAVIYEIRESLLDRLLGRQLYIPASAGHALSDDRRRLVVPDETVDVATPDLRQLAEQRITVRSHGADGALPSAPLDGDETVVVHRADEHEDETVVRLSEEGDETVVRKSEEDGTTVVPLRRRAG